MTKKIMEYNGNKRELDHLIFLAANFRTAHKQGQLKTARDMLIAIHEISVDYADALYGELTYEERFKIIRYA